MISRVRGTGSMPASASRIAMEAKAGQSRFAIAPPS
jgi:hypothetical protein